MCSVHGADKEHKIACSAHALPGSIYIHITCAERARAGACGAAFDACNALLYTYRARTGLQALPFTSVSHFVHPRPCPAMCTF